MSTTGASVSVCLCTYRGERFLEELLASLAAQQRLPDELVACDDGSPDRTVAILESFAATAPFSVRIVRNDTRRGVTANFEQAVALATGDVIFLCDQDDRWRRTKIADVTPRFENSHHVSGVFHDSEVIDANGALIGTTLWQQIGFGTRAQRDFAREPFVHLVRHPRVAGHAVAFRASLRPVLLPFPRAAAYDVWIGRLLAGVGELVAMSARLVEYRLHGDNAAGLRHALPAASRFDRLADPAEGWLVEAAALEQLARRLCDFAPERLDASGQEAIAGKESHLRRRAELATRSPQRSAERVASLRVIAEETFTGRYHLYSNGMASAVFDVARTLRPQ